MNKQNVILLHGYKQDSSSLTILEEKLKAYFNIYNLNYTQFKNDKVLTLNNYVLEIHNIIKDLNNPILIGHSLGGKVATLYACKYKVKKIILIAPSTYRKITLSLKVKVFFNKVLKGLHLKKTLGSKEYKVLSSFEKKTFNNIIKNVDIRELKKLHSKTLIIGFNNDDKVKAKDLKRLNKLLKNSSLHFFKGDHFSYVEHAEDICLLIMDFIYDNL